MFALFYFKNKIIFWPGNLFLGIIIGSTLFFSGTILVSGPTKLYAETDVDAREAELRAELKKIEAEQAALQKSLDAQKGQTATIQRDVNVLTAQIKQAELNIKKKKLEIEGLSKEIRLKDETVAQLNEKVKRSQEALAELVKKTNDQDNYSLPEILLGSENLSDFFVDLDSYNALQKQLETLFQEIRALKGETEAEKLTLEQKQNAELDRKKAIEVSKATVATKKSEQDTLLNASKQTEAGYQQILKEKQAKAATIRAALFRLRDGSGIQFGDAVKYAEEASRNTGVRAAFILGILKQETNIGQNLGLCTIADLDSGDMKGVNTGTIFEHGIHPTRDLPLLQAILKSLGRDPLVTRVSCPQAGGYGGAMGPSQFIPSTWQLFIPRLQQIFGSYPDPWNPEHSIMGTGLLLKDNGAAAGGYTAERNAACKYYSGAACDVSRQPPNVFYGNAVLVHTEEMQKQIDFLDDADN